MKSPESVVGGFVFAGALGVMASRGRQQAMSACAASCAVQPLAGIPIACEPRVFTQEERAAHVAHAKELLITRALRRQELDDGFEFHYEGDEKLFSSLAQWASLEHRCCPWARFAVEMEPFAADSAGTLRLHMTGGPEGKQLLLLNPAVSRVRQRLTNRESRCAACRHAGRENRQQAHQSEPARHGLRHDHERQ